MLQRLALVSAATVLALAVCSPAQPVKKAKVQAVVLTDERPSGTDGGAAPRLDQWFPRQLNIARGTIAICSLNPGLGEFSLAAGEYVIRASVPVGYDGGGSHQARIFDVTAQAEACLGSSEWIPGNGHSRSMIACALTLAKDHVFRIETLCTRGDASHLPLLGVPSYIGTEVYTIVEIEKLSQ